MSRHGTRSIASFLLMGPKLISALQVARETEGVETPKLGGVTRWCQDKFTCMQFLAKNMDTVSAFVYSESEKARASKSIIKCKRLLDRYGALEIKASCFTFLEQCSVFAFSIEQIFRHVGETDGNSCRNYAAALVRT